MKPIECECLDEGHVLEYAPGNYAVCLVCGEIIPSYVVMAWYFNKLDGLLNRVSED